MFFLYIYLKTIENREQEHVSTSAMCHLAPLFPLKTLNRCCAMHLSELWGKLGIFTSRVCPRSLYDLHSVQHPPSLEPVSSPLHALCTQVHPAWVILTTKAHLWHSVKYSLLSFGWHYYKKNTSIIFDNAITKARQTHKVLHKHCEPAAAITSHFFTPSKPHRANQPFL